MKRQVKIRYQDGRESVFPTDSDGSDLSATNPFEIDWDSTAHESITFLLNDVEVGTVYSSVHMIDEPDMDDSVKCCPECETPNQFGEVCVSCAKEARS